jgi:hypothetical protein
LLSDSGDHRWNPAAMARLRPILPECGIVRPNFREKCQISVVLASFVGIWVSQIPAKVIRIMHKWLDSDQIDYNLAQYSHIPATAAIRHQISSRIQVADAGFRQLDTKIWEP